MNISEEIKRMMSLLDSKMGNVKPLISEENEPNVESVSGPEDILKRAINTGCWTNKKYVIGDPSNPISRVSAGYLYALNKVDPSIKVGDPFVKLKVNDIDVYMFGTPTTNAQHPGAYMAITRNSVAKPTTPDPNVTYLEAHGWNCQEFKESLNPASQQTDLTADQQAQIQTLASQLGVQDTGYTFFTRKPEDEKNYVKIDLATGIGTDGVSYLDKFNLADRIGPFKSQPGKFFIWANVGTQEKLYDIPKKVESFLSTLGFTRTRPDPGTAEIESETTLKQLCDGQGKAFCDPSVVDYIKTDGNRRIWKMSPEQAKAAGNVSYKDIVAQQAELGRKGTRQGLKDLDKQKANKPACQAAIQQLSNCERYGTPEDCAEALGLAEVDASYAQILDDTKQLVRTCVQNEVGLGMFSKNLKAQLSQLQGSTSPFGLRVATTQTPRSLEESLNNSIKSVIRETINKNNNKNLDSIIKNNLRRYIR